MATHSSMLCLENPKDRGAWRATVWRVAELDRTQQLNNNKQKKKFLRQAPATVFFNHSVFPCATKMRITIPYSLPTAGIPHSSAYRLRKENKQSRPGISLRQWQALWQTRKQLGSAVLNCSHMGKPAQQCYIFIFLKKSPKSRFSWEIFTF